MKRFIDQNPDFLEQVKGEITMKKTEFINNSLAQVLTATMSGVNSPHPQKVKADEVDLIPWVILQEALSMPQSKNDVDAVTILGSTRKFAHGPMQKLIDDNEAEVFAWCAWEVMEPFPFHDPEMMEKIFLAVIKKFGNTDIMPKDLTQFTGYYKWKDFIGKIRSLDVETLRTQWFCEKPDSSGLIYPQFSDVLNMETNFQLDRAGLLSLQIWEDFGYARDHPNCISLVQVNLQKESFVQFDELSLTLMKTQDIIIEVVLMLMRNGLVAQELMLDLSTPEKQFEAKKTLRQYHNYAPYFTMVRLWVPDYHGLTEIADRRGMGCPIPEPPKITHDSIHPECPLKDKCPLRKVAELYDNVNGIPHVRNFIDERRGKMTPNCIESRAQFMAYARKKKADGTYTDDPEKKNDHFPDNWKYGTIYNWYNIAYQPEGLSEAMPDIDSEPPKQNQKRHEEIEDYEGVRDSEDDLPEDGSYVGDLYDRTL